MSERIGIIGFGRFGRALGQLFEEAGHTVRAFDAAGVEAPAGTATPAQLAASTDVIVLAVPIGAMRAALEAVRPHLGGDHLVLDVGSVKTVPVRAMREVLGGDVPWAGTHPLFGPTSLTLGERPLRVVITPATEHPSAAERARTLYERAGCEVVFEEAEAHDRVMAETHALAYYVAKGVMDAGLKLDAELAPPSSQAILRTVEAVRSDAGHLFAALHLDNPYAADMRQRFLDALAEIDRTLQTTGPTTEERVEAFSIPDLGARSPEIRQVRDLIDDVDRELVGLLARRLLLSKRAGRAKAEIGAAVRDPQREAKLLAERRRWAESLGLDPDEVERLFQAVLRFSRKVQSEG